MILRLATAALAIAALLASPARAQFQPSAAPDPALAAKDTKLLVEALASAMRDHYVDSLRGAEVSSKLIASLRRGDYRKFDRPRPLVEQLARDVQAVIHDGHFNFLYFPPDASGFSWVNQGEAGPDSAARLEEDRKRLRHLNFGIAKAEILEGNIGWLTISRFDSPSALLRAPLAAAFEMLKNTDALIIDLRRNPGGLEESVELVFSYLAGEAPFLATSKLYRGGKPREDTWTVADPGGPKYLDRPVYVLISGATASGAEMFSYQVKHRKKGTLVGSRTTGGAHSFDTFQIGDQRLGRFMVLMPNAKTVDALTGGDWEGVGVAPDVETPPAAAPATAIRLALEALMAKAATAEARAHYTGLIERMAYTESHGPPAASDLEKYVGRYGIRRIFLEGAQLKFQRDGGPAVDLEPVAENTFELNVAMSPKPRLRFDVVDGHAAALLLNQNGREERIAREP